MRQSIQSIQNGDHAQVRHIPFFESQTAKTGNFKSHHKTFFMTKYWLYYRGECKRSIVVAEDSSVVKLQGIFNAMMPEARNSGHWFIAHAPRPDMYVWQRNNLAE